MQPKRSQVPALRWGDLGDAQNGFSLINESEYGYDAKGNVLRISLLCSPTWPDPDADQGRQHFFYALYPHAGDWKQALTVRQGYDFDYRLSAMEIAAPSGSMPAGQLLPENRSGQCGRNSNEEDRRWRWASGTFLRVVGQRRKCSRNAAERCEISNAGQPDGNPRVRRFRWPTGRR
jgi:Glycosyl hydrolases family 38 C-terminal domain